MDNAGQLGRSRKRLVWYSLHSFCSAHRQPIDAMFKGSPHTMGICSCCFVFWMNFTAGGWVEVDNVGDSRSCNNQTVSIEVVNLLSN
jgi:hypothetical protein